MRGFLVICLATVAIAAPQYSYTQPSDNQGSYGGGSGGGQQSLASLAAGTGSFGGGGNIGGGAISSLGSAPSTFASRPVQTIYNKQFYIHSAPEDEGLEGGNTSDEATTLRKNLRVVIVKAPENKGLTRAALQLAKSASEDKTVVYVLNKQSDLGQLQQQLNQLQESNPNKPEVHFVKYKTPEEAEHAQHSIQSQYDNFGGPTQVLDQGVAPVQNFIGSLGTTGSNGNGFLGSASNNFGNPTIQNTYLPVQRH